MSKVRIGFVGVGGMGQAAHLRNYVNIPECEVVALAEVRQDTAKQVAARFGILKVYKDHMAMLAAEQLDGIVASQPFDRHAFLLPELYSGAKYLFTEKPISVAIAAGEKLAGQARSAGCTHMVGYHKRSDPATAYAKATINEWKLSGKYGKLRYIRLLMPAGDWIASGFVGLINAGDQAPAMDRELPDGWRKAQLPGWDGETSAQYVSFVNYYIHQVNLMRHLLGESYRVTYADNSGVLLAVESASGVTGTIEMSPYCTTVDWQESALVAFEKGYVDLRLPAPLASNRPGSVEVYADPGEGATPTRTIPTLPWVHAMRQQAINFVKVCRGEMNPPCEAAEAVEDLKVAAEYINLRVGK